MDIAVIVSGDGDFAPAIRALQDKGVRCEVISFKPNTSSDLVAVADEFMDIMKVASISRKEGRAVRASMSAPEMPAKEVNPEFGFREASPSVAAAALAALKTGAPAATSGNGRRTRGGTSRRTAAAPATVEGEEAAAPASAVETIADGDEQARRRRRRRGGRGRGRSRREDEAAGPEGLPAAEAGEIGWEEFDDLSQLDGADVEEREYGFEEADAATLAELGLSPEELAAMTAAAPGDVEEKPKRRTRTRKADAEASTETEEKPKRRTRTRKADAEASTETEASTEAEEKPKRRSTRSKASDETPADGTPAAPKRRSTRAKKDEAADSPDAAAGAEPEGIWGRFRSARKPRAASDS